MAFISIFLLSFFLQNSSDLEIKLLPVETQIFSIPTDLGFHNIHIAFELNVPHDQVKSFQVHLKKQTTYLYSYSFDQASVQHYIKSSDQKTTTIHNLDLHYASKLGVDAAVISVLLKNGYRKNKTVPIVYYQQKNDYALPVEGTWFISSGHDFGIEHRRHLSRGHFAWDFQKVDQNGKTNNGAALENHFAFGQKVLSVQLGIVIDIHDGEEDNVPGKITNRKANYIEIMHLGGEVSRYVHLKKNSIKVKVGDQVKKGQWIGDIGNSGYSETPHLHFGFQKNIKHRDGRKTYEPLPIQFTNYKVNSNLGMERLVKKGRPRQGEFVTN